MAKDESEITEFGQWVLDQMKASLIPSQHELARRGGISQSSISNVISGKRGIEIETALGIAKALKCDPIEVLRQAGVLPKDVSRDELTDRLARIVATWPLDERERFLMLALAQDSILDQSPTGAIVAGRISDEKAKYETKNKGKNK